MGFALAVYGYWRFAQHVEDDRNVMGSQIPGNVDVGLKKTQIQTTGANVLEFTQGAMVDDFFDFANRRRINKGMTDSNYELPAFCDLD
jgi:hypothetical protein